jgi:ribosomal protein S18 acetylase RimI-like enzyme
MKFPLTVGHGVKIRDLTWRDFQDLVDTYYHLYDELPTDPSLGILLFHERPPLSEEVTWFANLYRRVLEGSTLASVAEVNGHAVGLVTVGHGPHGEGAHVGDLGILVRLEARGKGIGKALLSDILGKCRGRYELVQLKVFHTNQTAKRLYRNFGFQHVGTIPRAIKRGTQYYDEELMVLPLTP